MRTSSIHLLAGALSLVLAALPCERAAAQRDTTVVAGEEYRATGLREWLLGDDYRDLWVAPVRVEFLDLHGIGGGLTVAQEGGGKQTRSLRLVDARGQEYAFRSVNKYPDLPDEPALRGTIVSAVLRDQISSLHPAAALVAAPLLAAAGVLHVSPRLVVMPDDPKLGEFREDFAGMLGLFEPRPDEVEEGEELVFGFDRIIGTERLLERIEEDPRQRVDALAYAKARLMDLLLSDWDRHGDQWRWGGEERDGVLHWLPIPRDRDYAFVDYDGVLPRLASLVISNAVSFGPRIDDVYGLTLNARELDRRLLAEVDRAAWDSLAVFLQGRITDEVIDDAVSRMPPEYRAASAARLASYLRSRRADLRDAAAELHGILSTEVDVHATDAADLALVERVADDVVDVSLFALPEGATAPAGAPYFRRRFVGAETNEVRVFLHGGDDHARVRGDVGKSLVVRVIGGGGDDLLVDSSTVRRESHETVLYDDRGENRFVRSSGSVVVEETWETPQTVRSLGGEEFRDWGDGSSWSFAVDYQNPDGVILGVGRSLTRYGFRKYPYARKLTGRVLVAQSGHAAVEAEGDFHRRGTPAGWSFLVRASKLDVLRFYGYGNDTEDLAASSRYAIQQDRVEARVTANFDLPRGGRLSVGPLVRYTNPDLPDDHPIGELPPYGRGGFGQVGAAGDAILDLRDETAFPHAGGLLAAGASAVPGLWSAAGAFGEAHAEGRAYLPVPAPTEATLAVRAGGQRVWGEFPVHEAAFLGGSGTLRGLPSQRFAGDAMLFGGAELRARLLPLELGVKGDLGALLLADAGRVFLDGESPGGWHAAYGGGAWFRFDIRGNVTALSLAYAHGEDEGRFYFEFGVPY